MAGLTLTPDQRIKLAERLNLNPYSTASEFADALGKVGDQLADRQFAEVADAWDDYLGVSIEDPVRGFEDEGELRDPTGGLLDLR